jgi:hypothetical protein
MAKRTGHGYEDAAAAAPPDQNGSITVIDPEQPKPVAAKPRRKPLSSGLQAMAAIERKLATLDVATQNRVLAWFKSLPPVEEETTLGT